MALWLSIVLDGVGIGELPDAEHNGDHGSDTLAHVCETCRPQLPNLSKLGLGNIATLAGVDPNDRPIASFGKLAEKSAGKDSTTGHWELGGCALDQPFPTFTDGFPEEWVEGFCMEFGFDALLSLEAISGTKVIEDCGVEHIASGNPIVYTSVDSVVQIAAHSDVISLDRLYEICERTRVNLCQGDYAVGRVIARPFEGTPGSFKRLSKDRRDYSLKPPKKVLQQYLQEAGVHTISVGKVASLFDWVGFDRFIKSGRNEVGIQKTLAAIRDQADVEDAFIWTNLIDFDQEFGHRNNPEGFAKSLEEFDLALPAILAALGPNDVLCITADHGNDPTFPGTDHTREYVPLLVCGGGASRDLGTRSSFVDHAASVADFFEIEERFGGRSFLIRT